jgi:hypothetical protein
MRFRFDRFVKELLRRLLASWGDVDTEVEVAVDAQRIDVLFRPRLHGRPPPFDLGLLGRMAASPCLFEVFHVPPTREEGKDAIRKLLAWHHLALLRAKRRARAIAARAKRHPSRRPPAEAAFASPPMPVLWILSSGRPEGALEGFAFAPLEGWPPGVYSTAQPEVPVRLVVLGELPPTRDTLPLRLMGRGATAERAAWDLGALPRDAWERRILEPAMISLQKKIERAQASGHLTEEEREILVNGQKLIDAIENRGWERGRSEGRQQGQREGRQQGQREGRQQGLEPVVHQFGRKLGRPLTERQRATILRRLDTLGPDRLGDVVLDLDAAALAAWLANPRAQ